MSQLRVLFWTLTIGLTGAQIDSKLIFKLIRSKVQYLFEPIWFVMGFYIK